MGNQFLLLQLLVQLSLVLDSKGLSAASGGKARLSWSAALGSPSTAAASRVRRQWRGGAGKGSSTAGRGAVVGGLRRSNFEKAGLLPLSCRVAANLGDCSSTIK